MSLLQTIGAFLLALGPLIVVHEFGHYLVARACGVKVLRFSLGFGRVLARWHTGRDRTEWALSAIPLGGYVKMLDEREGPVVPEELPRAFNRQNVWKRVAIVIAGPLANFLLAIVLYWGLFLHGVPDVRAVVGEVVAGSPAAQAGFTPDEAIVAVDGQPVLTWNDARWLLLEAAVDRARVPVRTLAPGGTLHERRLDLSGLETEAVDKDFMRAAGFEIRRSLRPVIGVVVPDGVAARGGLRPDDVVRAINGEPVQGWEQIVAQIRGNPGAPLEFEVDRNRVPVRITLVPDSVRDGERSIGRIGVGPGDMVDVRYGAWPGLQRAVARTWEVSVFSLRMLGKMLVGEVSIKNLSGPVTIADYAGKSAQAGWVPFLLFLALISISLGVLNLLPIPLLDGGHLLYYLVEIVKGSPVSERAMEVGQQVGMTVLFVLMAFALFNDVTRLISS
ncbi:MAG: RIP metalloprotease RseP [Burkholderiales bacterium]